MNNLTIGGQASPSLSNGNAVAENLPFAYYETIGGGMGARPTSAGPSALHSHMTNTLNTPVEAIEYAYPLRVLRYEIRAGSGGNGKYNGGEGIIRQIEVLTSCQLTLLSERRKFPPYGLNGGEPGKTGRNMLIRDDQEIPLPGKGSVELRAGDVLSIHTPGGGGYGVKSS
jgi:N-methylhydantoinase B